jgi:polyphosphate kinase 2 (PPK2 family)
MNLTKRLRVEPGSQVDLAGIDPSFHGKWSSAEAAKAELDGNLGRIAALQRKLYADRGHCLLIVLQGIDGAGKDGTCWHVMSAMDPQGVAVQGFKQPTPEEKGHDFLWRIHPHAPGARPHRHLQSLALRGCACGARPQACSEGRLEIALRPHQRLGEAA